MENGTKVVVAAAAGLAIGAVAGILFAPAKGSETRAAIANKTGEIKDKVVETAKEKSEMLGELKGYISDALGEVKENIKDELLTKIQNLESKLAANVNASANGSAKKTTKA